MWSIVIESWSDKGLTKTVTGPFTNRAAAENWWMASTIRRDENFLTASITPVVRPIVHVDRERNFVADWAFDWTI